jgi:carboxyl-terminal processing protease
VTSHAKITRNSTDKPKKRTRILSMLFAGLLIFAVGVNVGNGRLQFNKTQTTASNNQLPADLDYESVEAIYDKLRESYDGKLDEQQLLDGIKQGLAKASGDPYTEYFNIKDAKEFNEELNGSFTGIGAELGKNASDNVEIISPIAGFPAEKAGLKAKDVIAEIDGKSAVGITVTEAVSKIRGEAGTKVKLKIIRDNKQELDFVITRAQITIPSVKHEIVDGVGVLTISRFGPDTAQLALEAANRFSRAKVRGVILDLRGDPGGLLDAAVSVSSLWLDKTQVVLQEKRDGKVIKTLKSNGNATLKGIKTVVLINEGSASASEITAGALRDNKAATLIGTKTYGKGSVQQIEPLADGSLLKVTSAHWFTPSGKGIDKDGLEPDQKVERSDEDFKNGKDPQKDAAFRAFK